MPSLQDTPPNCPVILLVGPAGAGKTTFMTRLCPVGKKLRILDADGNLAGPQKVARMEKRDISHVEYEHITIDDNGKPVPPLMQYQRMNTLLTRFIEDPTTGLVGITSTTSLVPVFMNEVRRQGNKGTDYAFQIQDWGKYAALWTHFIGVLRACRKPVVIDGHVQADKGQLDTIMRWALAIPGSTGDLMPMMVTDFWRMSVESSTNTVPATKKYMVTTAQDPLWMNLKAALDVPDKFEANQEWAEKIIKQFPIM